MARQNRQRGKEFIGAAATLVYREWKNAGLQRSLSDSASRLLAASILDNTLNLTSQNTTQEDIEAYEQLCANAGIGGEFREEYFSEVQRCVERDLRNAVFSDRSASEIIRYCRRELRSCVSGTRIRS